MTPLIGTGVVSTNKAAEVLRGIHSDQDGALFAVITTATNAENFERLVVYRELFGDYKFWIRPTKISLERSNLQPQFNSS
jgi:hypothetical protein